MSLKSAYENACLSRAHEWSTNLIYSNSYSRGLRRRVAYGRELLVFIAFQGSIFKTSLYLLIGSFYSQKQTRIPKRIFYSQTRQHELNSGE